MGTHARLSPSAAARWLTCTAAPTLEAQFPDESSVYADEGSFAHKLAELEAGKALKLTTAAKYKRAVGGLSKNETYNAEMHECAKDYADHIKAIFKKEKAKTPDAFAELEVKLDLSSFIPEGFGTADCIIISDTTLYVIDFKYGKGVKVSAEGNAQMELYALGALELYGALYDIETVSMTIIQPRLGSVETAERKAEDLYTWAESTVKPAAEAAFNGPGEFCPSEPACRFCKAKGTCPARAQHYVDLFDDTPEPKTLTAEEAGEILTKAAGMKTWLSDLEAVVFSALMAGEPVSQWKLVEGKSNRKYTDEDKVAKALLKAGLTEEQVYTQKLVTITGVEKLLGKKAATEVLDGLVEKPEGKPTLAEISDKRNALSITEEMVKAFDEE